MKHEQTNIFIGMNKDTDIQLLANGDFLDSRNVRIGSSVTNNVGAVELLLGSTEIDTESLQAIAGTDKIIGRCKDYQNGSIYFFIHNDNTPTQYNRIIKLDVNSNTASIVLKDSALFGGSDNPQIVSASIYDSQLFWCNGNDVNTSNTLKHLDLKNNTYSDLDYTDPKEELITVIKIPPVLPITTTLEYDATLNLNKLNDLQYQFSYRFITKSGQFTRFSAVSELAVSGYQLQFNKPNKINITIPFTVDTQLLSRLYSSIEVCYRGKYTDDFKSFRKLDFPTTLETSITTTFMGNEAYTTVASTDYITEFDNVPLFADSVQYADTRVFWGDYSQDRYKQLVLVTETEDAPNGNLEYTPTENSQVLKPNSNYKYAIDLIDKYGRRSTSYVDGTSLDILGSITTNPQTGLVSTLQKKKFTIDLTGIADDYKADGFVQIRRSDNLSVSRFIQGRIEHAYYKTGVDVNGDPIFTEPINWASENYTTFNYLTNPNTTDSGCVELYVDISNWSKSNISYTFAQGDKLRFLTTGLKDTCLGNVNNLSDDKVEYLIKRQEGDILVLDYKNPIEIFGSWCLPDSFDGYWFFCGSNGFIQRRNSDETVTEVDNTWTGWYDGIRNTTFYGIIGNLGLISSSFIIDESYVCGENGILLHIVWSTKTINIITTGTTSTLRDIDGVMFNDGVYRWSMFAVGDKNGNGNGTILYIDNGSITDISDDIAFEGDITKCSVPKDIKSIVSSTIQDAWCLFISPISNKKIYIVKRTVLGVNTLTELTITTPALSRISTSDIGCNKFKDIDFNYTYNTTYSNSYFNIQIVCENGYVFSMFQVLIGIDYNIDTRLTSSVTPFWGDKISDYDLNGVTALRNSVFDRPMFDWQINGIATTSNGQLLLYRLYLSSAPTHVSTFDTNYLGKSKLNTVAVFQSALANTGSANYSISAIFGGSNKSQGKVYIECDDVLDNSIPILIPPSEESSISSINNLVNYGAMIEVFTPSSALSDQVYYEIGNVHKISELSPSYELTQEYNDGDCFYIKKQYYGRLWTLPKDYIISMSPNSNTWEYWFKDIARPNTEDLTVDFATTTEQKTAPFKRFTTNIIFSNPYIQGTKTNGLCTFELLNYKQLPIEYGDITALQVANNTNEDGSIMLSVHKHEIVSIYIGKVQYTDVAGNNTISLSDQVLGSYRTTNGSLGSLHKLSIAQFNSKVYGFDAIKGVVWRYGQDGVKRISDVGMINEFYQKGLVAVNDVTYFNQIIGEYNGRFDEYSLTFKNTAETYVWSERVNRWITIREYNSANALQSLNMQCSLYNKNYITTKNGIDGDIGFALYETDVSNDINNLVVGYNDASIQFVANKDVARVKNWNTLKVQCDELWDAYILNELGQLTFMKDEESEILGTSGDFQQLENDWFAPVLCDTQNSNNDRYVGDSLKSQTLTVNLVLNRGLIIAKGLTNKLVKLYNATITSSISFR